MMPGVVGRVRPCRRLMMTAPQIEASNETCAGVGTIQNRGSNRWDALRVDSDVLAVGGNQANGFGRTQLTVAPSGHRFSDLGPSRLASSLLLDRTLRLAHPTDATLNASLTGAARLAQSGAGQLQLQGDNTGLTGERPVQVQQGLLQATSLNSLPMGGVLLTHGGHPRRQRGQSSGPPDWRSRRRRVPGHGRSVRLRGWHVGAGRSSDPGRGRAPPRALFSPMQTVHYRIVP